MKTIKTKKEYPRTPELDKLKGVAPDSQKIGTFLDWLRSEKEYVLAKDPDGRGLYEATISIEQLLADYFEIDLKKVEQERRAILAWVREQN